LFKKGGTFLSDKKIEEDDILEINKIADKWQKEMAKGYTKVVALALLALNKMHGYQLVEQIKQRTFHFLTPNPSTIYPILNSLENKGFIKSECIEVGGRERKIYSITTEGKKILNEIIKRQQKIQESMFSMFQMLKSKLLDDIEINQIPKEVMVFDIKRLYDEITEDELIKELERRKGIIISRINYFREKLKELNEKVKSLKERSGRFKKNT